MSTTDAKEPLPVIQVEVPASRTFRTRDLLMWAYVSETGRLVVSTGPTSWVYLYPHEEVMRDRSELPKGS